MMSDFAKKRQQDVRDFYEQRGRSFSDTRKALWPEQILAAKDVSPGMTVLDVGAGNGRFSAALPDGAEYIGIEPSAALRDNAPKGVRMLNGELPDLGVDSNIADLTVCFAVLHHVPTKELRETSVAELIRVTKAGGRVIATAWFISDETYETVQDSAESDVWIPWKADRQISKRFVHRFTEREWKKLWIHPELEIEKIGLFGKDDWTKNVDHARNFMVIAKKKSA